MPSEVQVWADESTKSEFMDAYVIAGSPDDAYSMFSRCHYPGRIQTREMFLAAFRSGQRDVKRAAEEAHEEGYSDGYHDGYAKGHDDAVADMLDLAIEAYGLGEAAKLGQQFPKQWNAAVIRSATSQGDGS